MPQQRAEWEVEILDMIKARTGRSTPMIEVLNDLLVATGSIKDCAAYIGTTAERLSAFIEREGLIYAQILVPINSEYGVWARRKAMKVRAKKWGTAERRGRRRKVKEVR